MIFKNEYKMIELDDKGHSDNSIVFTVEDWLLEMMKGISESRRAQIKRDFIVMVEAMQLSKGVFCQTPWKRDDPASHDNVTAIIGFSYLIGAHFHKEVKSVSL